MYTSLNIAEPGEEVYFTEDDDSNLGLCIGVVILGITIVILLIKMNLTN